MRSLATWLRRLSFALVFGLLIVVVVSARVVVEGERRMAESDEAFHRGDVRAAVEKARHAAILYIPGAPHVTPAYQRLVAAAVGAEAAGDLAAARLGWSAVRAAAVETRSLWPVREAELARANHALVRLAAHGRSPVETDPKELRERLLSVYEVTGQSRAPAALGLLLGLVLTAAGIGIFGQRGLVADGGISWAGARLGLLLLLVGAACWTITVYWA
jgi:hypothetical protein